MLTTLAALTYYRRRILASWRDAIVVGVLPLGAAGYLGYILYKSISSAWDSARRRSGRSSGSSPPAWS